MHVGVRCHVGFWGHKTKKLGAMEDMHPICPWVWLGDDQSFSGNHRAGGRGEAEGQVRRNNPHHDLHHRCLSDSQAMICQNMWSNKQGMTPLYSLLWRRACICVGWILWRHQRGSVHTYILPAQNVNTRHSQGLLSIHWGKASLFINTWSDKNRNTSMIIPI